jgi:hypothetical protein
MVHPRSGPNLRITELSLWLARSRQNFPLVAGGTRRDWTSFLGQATAGAGMTGKNVNRKEGQTKIQPNPALSRDIAGETYSGGKHFRDTPAGPSDLECNPGIGSSPGTFSSGESGLNKLDECAATSRRARSDFHLVRYNRRHR